MLIQVLKLEGARPDAVPCAELLIGTWRYTICVSPGSVYVVLDRGLGGPRVMGKCFWSMADLERHYRKHGAIVSEYARKLGAFGAVPEVV